MIMTYHSHSKSATHSTEIDASLLKCEEITPKPGFVIQSTVINVHRNIDGVLFGPSISKDQRLELLANMQQILNKLEGDM